MEDWKTDSVMHYMMSDMWESAVVTGPDADSEWEPHFGSRAARELALWMKESLSPETSGGQVTAVVFG